LIKPWSIKSNKPDARVINSDAIVEAIIASREAARAAEISKGEDEYITDTDEPLGEGEASDGEAVFEEGLTAHEKYSEEEFERMTQEPVSEGTAVEAGGVGATIYSQSKTQATEEAEKILEDARTQADELIAQARESAEQIENEAKERGYAEGRESLELEKEAARNQMQQSFDDKVRALEEEYKEKQDNMERELVDTISEVYSRVFMVQFDNKKQLLIHLINNAMAGSDGDKSFKLKVNEDNVLFLENHREDMYEKIGHDVEIEILADSSLGENDCVIETESGIIDCSLGAQLDNLTRDLKSLCVTGSIAAS
jgi:flagellar assembly protein FliH